MPQLYELLEPVEVERLSTDAREKLAEYRRLREAGYSEGRSTERALYRIPTRREGAWDLAEPVLRWFHQALVAEAIPKPALPHPFQWVTDGTRRTGISFMARRLDPTMSKQQAASLSEQVRRILVSNRLVATYKSTGRYAIAPWPAGQPLKLTEVGETIRLTEKDLVVMARRVAEEANDDIRTAFRLSAIPIPDPLTPDTVKEYVKAVAASLDRANVRIAELESELADMVTKEWDGLTDDLTAIVND